jgi:hypothetical protein
MVVAGVFFFTACQNDNDTPVVGREVILSFVPTVEDMSTEAITRTSGGDAFFADDDKITVTVEDSRGNESGDYIFKKDNGGIFTGSIRFKLDNTYFPTIKALWPTETERNKGIITDQRKAEDYKKADRLTAEGSTENIMPTAASVPLRFTHEQSRLTFRLAGQNANGLDIKELILELQADLNYDGTGTPNPVATAFWAYCESADGNAELILPPGIVLKPETTTKPYNIGLVTIKSVNPNVNDYRGSIYLDSSTNLKLEANKDYVVTLTPSGANWLAVIRISEFGPSEGYVGIPVQLPELISVGNYKINTVTQLITISYLLQGLTINLPEATGIDWSSCNYTIDDNVKMTANGKLYYKPMASLLKGQFNKEMIQDEAGANFSLFQ